ncbi:hypothetical protein TrST_g7164 [Triparma strigata]|uniref:Tubby C-terminal domain-containing protein n=1 Tax=Triparma strigata TaxID=1606541 RepID=A0A9W7ASI3_9STRA|nr:hypothetical protein TrST_g7164 [Triparma strigata]
MEVQLSDDIWFVIISYVGGLKPFEPLLQIRQDISACSALLKQKAEEVAFEICACFTGNVSDSSGHGVARNTHVDGYVLLLQYLRPSPLGLVANDYHFCLSLAFRKYGIPDYIARNTLETFAFRIRKELEDDPVTLSILEIVVASRLSPDQYVFHLLSSWSNFYPISYGSTAVHKFIHRLQNSSTSTSSFYSNPRTSDIEICNLYDAGLSLTDDLAFVHNNYGHSRTTDLSSKITSSAGFKGRRQFLCTRETLRHPSSAIFNRRTFKLYEQNSDEVLLLTATTGSASSNIKISQATGDVCAILKSNLTKTKYTATSVVDGVEGVEIADIEILNSNLLTVTNLPRTNRVLIPKGCGTGEDSIDLKHEWRYGDIERGNGDEFNAHSRVLGFRNVDPVWNDDVSAFTLNFAGRVTYPSVKNFKLKALGGGPDELIVMQFGKVGRDGFQMDLSHPLSVLQGFCIALANLEYKKGLALF